MTKDVERVDDGRPVRDMMCWLRAVPNGDAAIKASGGLLALLGDKATRKHKLLLGACRDSSQLETMVARYMREVREEHGQPGWDDDVRAWLLEVKRVWGEVHLGSAQQEVLDRIEKVACCFAEVEEEGPDWSKLAFQVAMEMPDADGLEIQEAVRGLMGLGDQKLEVGSEEQEREFRRLVSRLVRRSTRVDVQRQLAVAFETVLKAIRSAAPDFLNCRYVKRSADDGGKGNTKRQKVENQQRDLRWRARR